MKRRQKRFEEQIFLKDEAKCLSWISDGWPVAMNNQGHKRYYKFVCIMVELLKFNLNMILWELLQLPSNRNIYHNDWFLVIVMMNYSIRGWKCMIWLRAMKTPLCWSDRVYSQVVTGWCAFGIHSSWLETSCECHAVASQYQDYFSWGSAEKSISSSYLQVNQ